MSTDPDFCANCGCLLDTYEVMQGEFLCPRCKWLDGQDPEDDSDERLDDTPETIF